MKLWKKMLIGIALGIVAGLLLGPQAQYLKPIGSIFYVSLSRIQIWVVINVRRQSAANTSTQITRP